ncbi:hypothetical protein ABZ318_29475 [Streptomyces sp. NPDC006197]|uniref:hypothetical protein n=1 Tax=Streptomyces sp. NPDC006197 TaxID=3156685 RepID=UPI0033B3C648
MVSGDPGRRVRLLVGGCLWAFIGALLLVVLGLLAVGVLLPRGLGRPAEPKSSVPNLTRAELTRERLETAAGDGELTGPELEWAAGSAPHHQETGPSAIVITVTYRNYPGKPGGCYRFVLPLPLSLDTRVELPRRGEGCSEGPRTAVTPPARPTAGSAPPVR